MKTIQISYTILDIIEVDDDMTRFEIDQIVEDNAYELGIYDLVNDVEWFDDSENDVK